MSIAGLLERGVKSVLDDPESEKELDALLGSSAMDAESADHVRQAVGALPGLLQSVERSLAAPGTPAHARELFLVVLSYMLDEENLIPSHAGKPLLGLIDDVYLLHLAALELKGHLRRVDLNSVAGGALLLEQLLPRSAVGALRAKIHEAREAVARRQQP